MLDRLAKWFATVLFVVVVGTAIGLTISIVIAEVPLWALVVVAMVVVVALFMFAVWAIGGGGYG